MLELASELLGEESDMARYTGLRLMFNMLYQRPAETLEKAEKELARACSLTSPVAAMMVESAGSCCDLMLIQKRRLGSGLSQDASFVWGVRVWLLLTL